MHIALSGVDGSGKGTQIALLSKYLEQQGYDVAVTKAYGDEEKETLAPWLEYLDDVAITLVFQAMHRQQYASTVSALKRGKVVISDRWDESFWAYHKQYGYLADKPELREALNQMSFNSHKPDLGILLDVDPRITRRRLKVRGMDYFDRKPVPHHDSLREGYLEYAREQDWHIIDGGQTSEAVHHQIIEAVKPLIDRAR